MVVFAGHTCLEHLRVNIGRVHLLLLLQLFI